MSRHQDLFSERRDAAIARSAHLWPRAVAVASRQAWLASIGMDASQRHAFYLVIWAGGRASRDTGGAA